MTNVLVTGGAGYIGSITVKRLRESGYNVVVLDNLEKGVRAAVGDTPLIEGQIDDDALLGRLFAEHAIDAVMHFAAYKAAGESVAQPMRYFQNNVAGTMTLLAAMQRAGVKHFIFSSTAAVYGTPEHVPVSEDAPLRPENPYGESKRIVEQMLNWLDHANQIRSISLRYYNAAGATLDGEMGEAAEHTENLIPRVLKAALGIAPGLKVFGSDYPTPDGTTIRDYIHVLDLAEAHIKALEYLRTNDRSDVFNLGTGKGSSVKQVLDVAQRVVGKTIPVDYVDRRPGDPVGVWADTRKAAELLQWTAKYDLEAIVESSWRWHSSHPRGYSK
jgi:UDP-glucose 4-epimerase